MIAMLKLDTPINLDVSKFLHWWWGELSFLVPERLRKYLGRAAEFLVLYRDEEGLTVIRQGPDGDQPLGRFTLDEAGSAQRQTLLEDHPELADLKVLLRLTAGQALRKTAKFPAAAEENLDQVLSFEMDRLTPFKSPQVYFAYKVIGRSPATRQITVEIVLVPREKLNSALDELKTWGWHPDRVDMEGDAALGSIDLLPPRYRRARANWSRTINTALAVLISSLLFALVATPIWAKRNLAEHLQAEVRKTEKVAKEVEGLRQELDKMAHEARFLQEKKTQEPVLVDMLEELSRVIPDSTWLNGLQYKDRRIVIQGQSPSASSLIELIEASDHFRNTSFVSPVTKDSASGLERFQIASDVVNGRFVEKAPAPQAAPE